ncbi:hypothetical protein H0N99_04020 [Candidatus Micrarchaeota archaeon]|nr:hypothetical protein [Candidatus Micrarchaeota archaeon]
MNCILLLSSILIFGCFGGLANQTGGQPNQTAQLTQCPAVCDDRDPCTNDYCNASTNFQCRHDAVKNCYYNDEYRFSLTYPDGWRTSDQIPFVSISFLGPTEDNFTSNCNIGEEELPAGTTLSQYVDAVKNHYRELYSDDIYALLQESNITVNGLRGYEYISTLDRGDHVQKSKRAILLRGQTAHIITCSAVPSTFSKSEPDFDTIINSFKFSE